MSNLTVRGAVQPDSYGSTVAGEFAQLGGPVGIGVGTLQRFVTLPNAGIYVLSDNAFGYGHFRIYATEDAHFLEFEINGVSSDPVELYDSIAIATIVKDNAGTLNVYRDSADGNKLKLQNNRGASRILCLNLLGAP